MKKSQCSICGQHRAAFFKPPRCRLCAREGATVRMGRPPLMDLTPEQIEARFAVALKRIRQLQRVAS